VHNDANNPMLSSLEEFGNALVSFSPHLVVIGGLQMMDSFPYEPGGFFSCPHLCPCYIKDHKCNQMQ
jgi:hypothetical protein